VLLEKLLALFTLASVPPHAAVTEKNKALDEIFLLEYATKRYEEMNDLLARSRQTGQTLLGWQTTLLLATLGVEAKARLLHFSSDRCVLSLIALAIPTAFLAAMLISGHVAFWTKAASVPTSPSVLYEALCADGIDNRKICETMNAVYASTRDVVKDLQHRIRTSVKYAFAGVLLLVALFAIISFKYPDALDQLFAAR
jgi:hypothetical protein